MWSSGLLLPVQFSVPPTSLPKTNKNSIKLHEMRNTVLEQRISEGKESVKKCVEKIKREEYKMKRIQEELNIGKEQT